MIYSNIESVSHGLKLSYWNINGLFRKHEDYCKLTDPMFINLVKNCDLIGLSEIHCGNDENIIYDGFHTELSIRPKPPKARKHSGGLLVLIKNQIKQGIKRIKSNPGNFMWLRLQKSFFNMDKDIYLCIAYISPTNSTYTRNTNEDYLTLIQNDIATFQSKGNIIIMGDLNARTSSISDLINNDVRDNYVPLEESYIQDCELPPRRNCDIITNERGSSLIDLCISAQLRILNGRTLGDLTGQFTCHKHNGSSTVDYCLVSEQFFSQINYFQVDKHLSDLSDHCRITCFIKRIKYKTVSNENLKLSTAHSGYRWNIERFSSEISSEINVKKFNQYLNTFSENIDTNADQLNNIMCSIANSSLLKKTNRKFKITHRNKWYNKRLETLRQIVMIKGKKLTDNPNAREHRHNYFSTLKIYRKACKRACRKFKSETMFKLDNLHTENPSDYWKLIDSLKQNVIQKPNKINETNWLNHFESLNKDDLNNNREHDLILTKLEMLENIPVFNNLDNIITTDEIMLNINLLKNKKSAGLDGITNEMLKCGKYQLIKPLHRLFNSILSRGTYPKIWAEGYIIPIHKKGNIDDPNNYRGITISSAIGKLFNTVLNNRLTSFLEDNNLICLNQIGFQKKCRTTDHMFVLKCIMDLYKKKKKKLFISFIDFSKAFDKVWHQGLFYKLKQIEISTNFYNVIKNMYSKISLQVRIDNLLTPTFKSFRGVRQGDNLSPSLFNIFINDIPERLKNCCPAKYNDLSVQCLLYADDLIIMSENLEGMQKALNNLAEFCDKWKLDINPSKSKFMCLDQTKNAKCNILKYKDLNLEQVKEYTYLGIIFSENGSFVSAIDTLYKKGLKSYFKLLKILNPLPSAKTMLHLFDHLVKPIILYGCEIWGPCNIKIPEFIQNENSWKRLQAEFTLEYKMSKRNNPFEKLHMQMCRKILGVNNKTSIAGIYGELGRYPLYINIIQQCQRYATHLENNEKNTLLQKIYKSFKQSDPENDNKPNILSFNYNLSKIYKANNNFISSNVHNNTSIFKERYRNFWYKQIKNLDSQSGIGNNKMRTYSLIKTNFQFEPYLNKPTNHTNLARFRLSAHKLKIETGRYNSKNKYVPPDARLCDNCKMDKIEEEIPFLTECPKYDTERTTLFASALLNCNLFSTLSNHNKFIWIMTNESTEIINALETFLHFATLKQIRSCY